MRPIFTPSLVNDPFGDPGLYVDFRFEHRALLFDLGELSALAPKKLLRVTDVFVTHTHMDHFVGFDRLLRICLGRDSGVRMVGPPGFVDRVEHRLASYSWNLVDNYPTDFTITALEIGPQWQRKAARFRCHGRFAREPVTPDPLPAGVVLDDPAFRIRAAFLDHQLPCLGYAIEESMHVNVWKNRLDELGVPTGPWLKELKQQVIANAPGDTPIHAAWRDRDGAHERVFRLDELERRVIERVPGEKIGYITDVVFHDDNARRIAALVNGADLLFIEAVFLDADADHAARKYHLTARQAGEIARRAGARRVVPFHFSPRYAEHEARLRDELARAHGGQS